MRVQYLLKLKGRLLWDGFELPITGGKYEKTIR